MTWQQYILFGFLLVLAMGVWNCVHHLQAIHRILIYLRDVERARRNERGAGGPD